MHAGEAASIPASGSSTSGRNGGGRRRRSTTRSGRARRAIVIGALLLVTAGAGACSSDQQASGSSPSDAASTGETPASVAGVVELRPVLVIVPPDTPIGPDVASGDGGMRYRLGAPTNVEIVGASASKPSNGSGVWEVRLQIAPGAAGIDAFNDAARACHSTDATCPTGQLAVMLDDRVVSAPRIQPDQQAFTPFAADQISISGQFDQFGAEAVAAQLTGG